MAGDGTYISPTDIAAQIQTSNREAARALDVMLRFLVPHSFLTCSTIRLVNGEVERHYGLAPAGKFYVRDELDGRWGRIILCVAQEERLCVGEYSLKDTVLKEGGTLFERIHGKNYYEFASNLIPKLLRGLIMQWELILP
ncbi:tyramine N-methyltransferase 1-like [Primulina tabacum]|uniref:tyramine N-methyltransferase 1-like n=1 Tax=Primulina tabacum TaxID=48773 RepID=UPI003F59D2B9